jgi:hypothetical protein
MERIDDGCFLIIRLNSAGDSGQYEQQKQIFFHEDAIYLLK